MKIIATKVLTLMLVILFIGLAAPVQAQTVQKKWSDSSGIAWFPTTGDYVRGLALNPVTNHLIVATRAINAFMILNASTGDTLGRLDTTGFSTWSGTLLFNRVGVSDDGRIYACNQVTAVKKSTPVRIYTWANESAKPVVAFSDSIKGPQLGDALAVVGHGDSTYVYLGGNGTTSPIQVFQKSNDSLLVVRKTITVSPASNGATSIGPMTSGFGPFWLKKSGKIAIRFDTTGAPIDTLLSSILATTASTARYYEAYGRKYIFAFDGNVNPSTARIIDITNGLKTAYVTGITPGLGTKANGTASGEAIWNPADSSMVVLSTNNSVGSYSTMKVSPIAKTFTRSTYVPLAGAADTVTANIVNLQKIASAKLRYMAAPDTVGALAAMSLTSGDSLNGIWAGVIPGTINTNGARISYKFDVTDVKGTNGLTNGPAGYFAGITKMAFTGSRAIDTTTGAILWNGYGIRVTGVCTQEDSLIAAPSSRTDVVVQDDVGGMDFIEFAATLPVPYRVLRDRSYTIAGQLYQYMGHIEVETPTASGTHLEVTDNGPGVPPVPKLLTIRDIAWDRQGEPIENSLVQVHHVSMTASSAPWPDAGAGGTNITVTDNGIDSLTLRVPALSNSNGVPPRQPFTLTGIASQFTSSSPLKNGYQIIMRQKDDVAGEIKVTLKDTTKALAGTDVSITAVVENINTLGILSYQFNAQFDSTLLGFKSGTVVGTISSGFTFSATAMNGGLVNVTASGATALKDSGALFSLTFTVLKPGISSIALTGLYNNGLFAATSIGGVVDGGVQMEVEPNDSINTSTPIAFGIPAGGTVSKTSGDPDFYVFQAPIGHLLADGTDAADTTDLRLTLYDSTGKALYDIDRNKNERLEYNLTNAGKYYIRVLGNKNGTTYATGPYQLMTKIGIPTDTREPNDGPLFGFFNIVTPAGFNYSDTTNTLDPGVGLAGSDRDYFSIIASPGQTIAPLVQAKSFKSATTLNHIQLSLYRKKAFSTALSTASKTDGSDVALSFTVAVADTYYVLVVNTALAEGGPNARYKLAIGSPTGVLDNVTGLPKEFALEQNYPNPFNPSTTIKFALPKDATVSLRVYDVLGRELRTLVNERVSAGYQQVVWNGQNQFGVQVASGMYIYRITAGEFISTKKMMMLK